MLSIGFLTEKDIQRLGELPKSFLITGFLYFALLVPMSFVLGALCIRELWVGYWSTTFSFLAFFALFCGWYIIRGYLLYQKDLAERQKLTGAITITEVKVERNGITFATSSPELKTFSTENKGLKDQIQVGDTLNIEFSKHSKTLLKLEKGGIDLLG